MPCHSVLSLTAAALPPHSVLSLTAAALPPLPSSAAQLRHTEPFLKFPADPRPGARLGFKDGTVYLVQPSGTWRLVEGVRPDAQRRAAR